MNGEERDDKERTRSHAKRLGESNGELGALADRRGGEQRQKACHGGYMPRRREPAEERSRAGKAAEEAAMRGGRIIPLGI